MRHHIQTWAQWPGLGLHAGKCTQCGATATHDTRGELITWIDYHEETP